MTVHGFNGPETRTEPPPEPANTIWREGNVCLVEDVNGRSDTDPDILPMITKVRERMCSYLWTAATQYQEQYISGVAIGLLTLGVAQRLPKSLAVMKWNGDLWSDYYSRKASIMAGGAPDYDFSPAGSMPYSVPELREELGL